MISTTEAGKHRNLRHSCRSVSQDLCRKQSQEAGKAAITGATLHCASFTNLIAANNRRRAGFILNARYPALHLEEPAR
jgi:hypothetical protein